MKLNRALTATLAALSVASMAAVTADEAKQLGDTLTDFGAIKAGNADGTIPPYTGGLTKAPADFKPDSGFWTDPYRDDKPLFRIDAKNIDKYADKLSEGQKLLLKKYPDYYLDIYPTHRSAAYPEKILKATVHNATACKTTREGLGVDIGCRGGMPFPIPKTGNEVMWDHVLRYMGDTQMFTNGSRSWVIDSSGKPTMSAQQLTMQDFVYYQVDQADRDPNLFWRTYSNTQSPARRAGEMTGLRDYLDPVDKPRAAWNYLPGQRRVKVSPDFAYDTPVASMGGVTLFDELFVFSGKMDRFDFKLVGRKEMYIPYNGYKNVFDCPTADMALQPKHVNPACERWELHRVWEVEATLKPGMRHVYSKRIYYFDEDWSGASLYDAFDQSGELYRSLFQTTIQLYDKQMPYGTKNVVYDFNRGLYAYINDITVSGTKVLPQLMSEKEMNPEAVVGRETAR
jgi:Protein of unknown function (DUF1329)